MIDLVRADLEWVAEYWPDLLQARLPLATARPRRPNSLPPTLRAVRDAEARLERLERSGLAPGQSPAPVDVDVLQTALDLLVQADDLAAAVAEHTGLPALAPPRFGELDARPYLRYAAEHLPESLAEWAAPITRRMVEHVADVLGMTYDGQTLAIVCPWCRGVTPETPAGGAHTWRVRILPGDQVAIVCESGTCEPPLREVGTWWRGRPCWRMEEWERLARLVQVG